MSISDPGPEDDIMVYTIGSDPRCDLWIVKLWRSILSAADSPNLEALLLFIREQLLPSTNYVQVIHCILFEAMSKSGVKSPLQSALTHGIPVWTITVVREYFTKGCIVISSNWHA